MKRCINCGAHVNNDDTFCPMCGGSSFTDIEEQPQYNQPQYNQPQYNQPQYNQPQYNQPQYGGQQYAGQQYGGQQYAQPQYAQPQYAEQPTEGNSGNPLSVVGFILSFIPFVNILGLIFGIVGAIKAKKKNGKGKGLAIAAIIIGSIGVVVSIVSFVLIVSLVMGGAVIDKANAKSAFSDARNALSIYIADYSNGDGATLVNDGSVFVVEKSGKYWRFEYSNNGLVGDDYTYTSEYSAAGSAYYYETVDWTDDYNLPTNVTIYLAPYSTDSDWGW